MHKKVDIVFRRKVRAGWLAQGLELAAAGATWASAKAELEKEIAAEISGRITVSKVLEHVRRIWFEPPKPATILRDEALRLWHSSPSAHTPGMLNWGMTIAAYPFVCSVGEAAGRLLRLQREFHCQDVQRRLRERYGDRDFVRRATRFTLSSFLDWQIIARTPRKGVYAAGRPTRPADPAMALWLAEAVLLAQDKPQMPLAELASHPALFPFILPAPTTASLQANPRLRVERQSFDQEVLFLTPVASGKIT